MAVPGAVGRILEAGAGELGVPVSHAQRARLERHLLLIAQWGSRLGLTGVRAPEEAARVLSLGALSLLPLMPRQGAIADLGSGAGVPGVPIAVMRPQARVVLVEASQRKAGFLEVVLRELRLPNAEVLCVRAETIGHVAEHRAQYHVVTARALSEVRVLVEYALPLLRIGGIALFPRGPGAAGEVASAACALGLLGGQADVRGESSEYGSPVVVVRKVAPTPSAYPRRPGVPARRPL